MLGIYVCASFVLSVINGLHLPKYIKPCQLNSPDFKQCAIQHGNEAIPFLTKGDRAYGIPSFIPFKISFVAISSHGFDMNLTDATFSGVENLRMQDYIFDPVKKFTAIVLTGPLIIFEFDYSTKGQIAALPIEGNGHGWAKFYNSNFTYAHEFDLKVKNGKHFMSIGKDEIIIEPERMESELGNLFNGNKQLGDNLNRFLNENWRELLEEFAPVISEVYGSIAKEVLRKLYDRIPLEETFPGTVF